MKILSAFFKTSNRQILTRSILLIVLTSFTFALPYTLFQYLNLRYSISHRAELQYIINTHTSPDGQSVTTNYGYRSTPWEMAANVSGLASLIVPTLVVLLISAFSLFFSTGSLKRRYFLATLMTLIFIPVTLIDQLPWAWVYSEGNLYDDGTSVTVMLTFFHGLVVFVCAGIINAILVQRLKKQSKS